MKTFTTLLIALLTTAAAAQAFNISGIAVDTETGNPLPGIELGLEVPGTYEFTTTGGDGSFTFSGLSNGSYFLYYWQSNFINGAYYLHQDYGQVSINGGNVDGITFEIEPHFPEYEIVGTIYDAWTGMPIEDLNYGLFIEWDYHPGNWDIFVPASDGTFSIPNLPDWSYQLIFYANNDYEEETTYVTIEKNGPQQVVADIYLTPKSGPFIAGVVMDFDTQEPISLAGRTIRLSDLPSSHFTQTDENGEFKINGLDPGYYYKLEVRTQDTAYINGEGSIVYDLTVPEGGLTDVVIYQHKFESVHEVVASTDEFTAGETQTIDFNLTYDDPVYGEIWGLTLHLPDGVTAISTPVFASINSGNTIFSRQYDCSSSSRLVWEGYHSTFYFGNQGNLEILNDEVTSAVTLQFEESLAGEDIEIGYEVYYALACSFHYFSFGSIVLEDNSTGATAMGKMQGFSRDAVSNLSVDNIQISVLNTPYQTSAVETPFGAHYKLDLPVGVYTVMCESTGYETAMVYDVEILEGQNMNHNFYLQPEKLGSISIGAAQQYSYKYLTGNNAGFNAENSSVEVSLSPNPATSTVTIVSNENVLQVNVLNLNGQSVLENYNQSSSFNIDVSDLPSGLYVVQIQTRSGSMIEKLSVR